MESKSLIDHHHLYIGVGQGRIHEQHWEVMGSYPGQWHMIDRYVKGNAMPMDATQLGFKTGSLSTIYTSHLLEHISHRSVVNTLTEWYRVLEPGGRVIINVPSLTEACKWWLDPSLRSECFKSDERMVQLIFGPQDYPGEYHYVGFSEESLAGLLAEVGFSQVDVHTEFEAHECWCIIARAMK